MKQCPHCGAELPDEARFCIHCMTVLTEKTFLKPIKIIGRWQRNSAIALLICICLIASILAAPYLYKLGDDGNSDVSEVPGTETIEETDTGTETSDGESENSVSEETTDPGTETFDEEFGNDVSEETTDSGIDEDTAFTDFEPDDTSGTESDRTTHTTDKTTNKTTNSTTDKTTNTTTDKTINTTTDKTINTTTDKTINTTTDKTTNTTTDKTTNTTTDKITNTTTDKTTNTTTDKTTNTTTDKTTNTTTDKTTNTTTNETTNTTTDKATALTNSTTNNQTTPGTSDTGTKPDVGSTIPEFNNGFIVAVNQKTEVPSGYVGIYTKQDLKNIRDNLASNYILMNDIEFTDADFIEGGDFYNDGQGWTPIGIDSNNAFCGIFDGNGHKIKNLYLNINSYKNTSAGLFGVCVGVVKNLGMIDPKFSGTIIQHNFSYFGSIAGTCSGTILNCYNTGKITVSTDSYVSSTAMCPKAGGIAGYLKGNGVIQNCYNTGEITGTSADLDPSVGGIVGLSEGQVVTNCKNYGRITAERSGGIVGTLLNSKITNCNNFGKISGNITGGISGMCSPNSKNNSIVENCGNEGSITSTKTAGGIVGDNYWDFKIIGCYNRGAVTAPRYVGGIIGELSRSNSVIRNCYNAGKITKTTTSGFLGGIVGNTYGTVEYCYNAGNISPAKSSGSGLSGGIAGYSSASISKCYYIDTAEKGIGQGTGTSTKCTAEQMKQISTFTEFDFTSVWMMNSGSYPYPVLRSVQMVQ